jgi:adenine C2-methylase RlmN of 23S rRNA A2503 and tRNA A37
MRHDGGRNTLCVSSQVGCKMGCTFCATGTLGELGNLTSGEILEQVAHARRFAAAKGNGETDAVAFRAAEASAAVTNVVFMGMGEPLNNYDAVCASLGLLSDARGFAVAPSRVTVSTVGVVPKMLALARDSPEVRLALSLHAPNQALREKIVPTATAYPLPKIMAALDAYLAAGTRARTRAMIEYCVLGGVNDEEAHAFELGELLRGRDVIVNLIPFNPTDTPMGHTPPTREAVQAMAAVLAGPPFGLRTTVRKEMGQDIAGACGQLALDKGGARRSFAAGGAGGDLEDLAGSAGNGFARAKTVADKKLKKGSVVNGRVARAFKEDVQTNKSRTTSVQTMTSDAPRRATDVTKKKQIPRHVELAVAALNATATISMVVLVLAVSWKLAAHAGWFEDHERQHAEL